MSASLNFGEHVQDKWNTGKALNTWLERERYYYRGVREKLLELLEASNECIRLARVGAESDTSIIASGSAVEISSFPIEKRDGDLYSWWRQLRPPKQIRVDPYLCDEVNTKRVPIWKNSGCQLKHYMHPSAPRCQTRYLKWICDNSRTEITVTQGNGFILPESDHSGTENPPQPYLVKVRDALVSMCGDISMACGYLHTTANCMATGHRWQAQQFHQKCFKAYNNQSGPGTPTKASTRVWKIGETAYFCDKGAPWDTEVIYHKRVFVVNEVDDTYVYHIHVEIMPRVMYHLEFLLANPDVKIMFGCDSKKKDYITQAGLAHGLQSIRPFFELVGLDMGRIVVHKHVHADEVYLPMEGGCQDPVYQTWPILHMRKVFMRRAGIEWESSPAAERGSSTEAGRSTKSTPTLLLLKRSSDTKHTRNGHDSVRQWSDNFANRLVLSLERMLPNYNVVLFSDRNSTMMACHACQMRAFHSAKVVIGMHGAGLSNMLYMRPGSAVVEFAPYANDARCLPGGGPFSRLSAVMSHNYMMHHPPIDEYRWTAGRTSEFNDTRFATHIRNFLASIDFL